MSDKQVTRKSSSESAGKITRKTDYIYTNDNVTMTMQLIIMAHQPVLLLPVLTT